MKYYLIAGERSGDLHGSNLIRAIKEHDADAEFRAWGGEQMQAAGATIVTHYADMAFMGFWEVIKNIFTISGFLKKCKADLLAYQPDAIILIDYAGFNMRMAKFDKAHGIKTLYYISPKVWAWNQNRALKIKQCVDQMYVIFPFEKDFFKKFDYEVHYVGNPLLDVIHSPSPDRRGGWGERLGDSKFVDFDLSLNPSPVRRGTSGTKPIVAILPGSRRQEVVQMLETMLSIRSQFADYQFVIAGVSNLPNSLYDEILTGIDGVSVVYDSAYELLATATAALVTSGTATLETALFGVPQVVCYKSSWLSYQIGKRVIRVPFISLVNLVAEKEVVKELIQNELTAENLATELKKILPNSPNRQTQINYYTSMRQRLGTAGASDRAGKMMVEYLQNANF